MHKRGSCATFFDPTGHGGPSNPEGAGETTQTTAFLKGDQPVIAKLLSDAISHGFPPVEVTGGYSKRSASRIVDE
jgi:hypothetical protein